MYTIIDWLQNKKECPKMTRVKQTKQQYVYEYIRSRIINNELTPGTIITEDSACNTLNVSRTPVREAIRRLTSEGLLVVTPGIGLTVPSIGLEDLIEIYDIREALESLAVRLFIGRSTPAVIEKLSDIMKDQERAVEIGDTNEFMRLDMIFHRQIDTVAGNKRLSSLLDSIYEQISRLAFINQDDPHILDIAIPVHKKLMKYIISGDKENAVLAIQEHIRTLRKYYLTKYFDL
jgi:DNA-binding GntR family transcriptional regulator